MCGIAGAIAADPREDVGPLVEGLTQALAHRGPDGSGLHFLRDRFAALGHRRLSIVDLEGGAQPMANEDGRVWVVLNGELYNHLELRRALERLGHRFRTRADTEVLVHGWEEWGPSVLQRLNGMYAFALFDARAGAVDGEVWLARDPVGVKPLYLGHANGVWWFASELAAARACGLVGSVFRPDAFDEYLVYRFVPSPGTFYNNAWKLPPGHFCRFSLGALPPHPRFTPFTTHFSPTAIPRREEEWQEALRAGLVAAVKRQLMSDVPLGSLLSGGVDSTVITGIMRDALQDPPMAFGVGFADAPDGGELALARRAATALGVPLTAVTTTESEYLEAWPAQAAMLGEPVANSGVLLVGLLCRAVKQARKVVLTGQGADEPLGGYPRHVAERFYAWMRHLRPVLELLPESVAAADRVARMRRVTAEDDEARRYTEILAVFTPREATALTGHSLAEEALSEPVRRWLPEGRGPDHVNTLLRVDARLSLADDLLIIADHMSMASSVELRVPFLDLEFLALIESMPSSYKVSSLGERKWLYRRAVTPLMPASLRPSLLGWRARTGRKLGFATPLDRWFGRWMASEAEEFLCGKSAFLPHYLRADKVRSLVAAVRERGRPRSRQLSSLYVLEAWLRGRREQAHEPRTYSPASFQVDS